MSAAPRAVPHSINGWSAEYLEEQYRRFRSDPASVPSDVRAFFQGHELAAAGALKLAPGAPGAAHEKTADDGQAAIGAGAMTPWSGSGSALHGTIEAAVEDLVSAYRDQGHLVARIDPFGRERPTPRSLSLDFHGVTDADLDREVDGAPVGLEGRVTLRRLIEHLQSLYCGTIGVEFMHIQDPEQRSWLLERFERSGARIELDRGQRVHLLELLTRSEMFERFLGRRYPGEKRFSLEGAESLIPLLSHMLEASTDLGVEEIVLGMAHRGRLNVLNNVLGKTYEQIFTEFEENWEEDFVDGGGDVKYHRGYSGTRRFPNGKMLHLAMASNPSHLEAVDAVVLGRCRAKQRLRADTERRRVIPVLMHGDAAIVGQGIVAECLNYSQLEGYTTGGCVHIVVNNQIGFTTLPVDARSSRYCTDIGKAIDAPIFHVNGEDVEAVVAVAQFAIEYRQRFRRDVFIDLQCFRRFGHNEQDEQSFTQPRLVRLIKQKPGALKIYADKLLEDGVITDADTRAIRIRLDESLEKAQDAARKSPNDPTIDPGSARWAGLGQDFSFEPADTAVPMETLEEICAALGRTPAGFKLNPKLKNLLKSRADLPRSGDVSYADAESLAYGTLLLEGHPVRLSGQDCRRGTFSHRHAVLRDYETAEPYIPLNNIRELGELGTEREPGSPGADGKPRQARFCVYDSPLSEAGVLGFDYGYSLADPNMLVLWEAQFGDFVNGAQVIIDQFIASAESKWDRWSGLVMLLPHGYEGAGPEHSSARLERFLKLCGNHNMQVAYPTTGAQTFHMLRRQLKRPFRKPLVVMSPKSLLRVPTSRIEELTHGSFQEILDDPRFENEGADRSKVSRILICSGKIYFELDQRRKELEREDVAIVRIEQIYPFHGQRLRETLQAYPKAATRAYVQEEPRNAGAFLFVADQMHAWFDLGWPEYIGRPASSTPAVGSKRMHKIEQEQILAKAVGPLPEKVDAETERKADAETPEANGAAKRTKAGPRSDGKAVSASA